MIQMAQLRVRASETELQAALAETHPPLAISRISASPPLTGSGARGCLPRPGRALRLRDQRIWPTARNSTRSVSQRPR